jgi:hypothetical protein
MQRRADPLRFIAVRLSVPEVEWIVGQPGVAEVFRVTIQYHDGRHPDQIGTAIKGQSPGPVKLAVHYRRANDKPLVLDYTVESDPFTALSAAIRKLGFDKLDDFPDIPWYGADLWLVERGAGSFHHDIIIPPDKAAGPHAEIVQLVRQNLPPLIRAVNP